MRNASRHTGRARGRPRRYYFAVTLATAAGALLEARREAIGLSQAAVARSLRIPQSVVSRVETGATPLHLDDFAAWCHALELDPVAVMRSALRSQDERLVDAAAARRKRAS